MMKMTGTCQKGLILVLMLAPAATAAGGAKSAPPGVLSIIPDDAWAILYLPSLDRLDNKFTMFAQRLNLPMMGKPTMMARMMLGLMAGVDNRGEFAAVLLPVSDTSRIGQSVVLFVPTSDYTALTTPLAPEPAENGVSRISILGDEAFVASRGGYAIIAHTREVVARALKPTGAVRSRFNRHQIDRLALDDITVWAHLGAVTSSGLFTTFVHMLEDAGAANNAQSLRQFRTAQMSLRFEPTGLAAGVYIDADPASEMGKALAATPTSTESLLAGLPGGPFVFAMGQMSSELQARMSADSVDQMFSQLEKQLTEHQEADGEAIRKVIARVRRPLKELIGDLRRLVIGVSVLPKGSDGLLAIAKVVTTAGDSRSVSAAVEGIVSGLKKDFADNPDASELLDHIVYKAAVEKVAGIAIDHLVITIPERTRQNMGAEALAAMKAVLGSEGLLVRLAPVDSKHAVVTLGGGTGYMRQVIDAVRGGLAPVAKDPGVARVAPHLPKKRSVEMYLNADQLAMVVSSVFKAVGRPFPYAVPQVHAPLAVTGGPAGRAGNQSNVYLPIELLEAIKDAVSNAMGRQMNGEAPAS